MKEISQEKCSIFIVSLSYLSHVFVLLEYTKDRIRSSKKVSKVTTNLTNSYFIISVKFWTYVISIFSSFNSEKQVTVSK